MIFEYQHHDVCTRSMIRDHVAPEAVTHTASLADVQHPQRLTVISRERTAVDEPLLRSGEIGWIEEAETEGRSFSA